MLSGMLQGLGVTLKSMTSPKVTTSYPDEPIHMPDRFRGIQHFIPELCIVCNQCARICPTDCITLTGKPNPDPEKRGKVIDTFDINFEICILCDLCTDKNAEWLTDNNTLVRKDNNNIGAPAKGGAK
jgi:NADH-quinone oxidoreductase subunit I